MKKIVFLVIGMVLCLAVVGGAIAVEYYDAPDKNGTLTADSCIKLSLDNSTAINALELAVGDPKYYEVKAEVIKSASAGAATGCLTFTLDNLADAQTVKSAANVKIDVYSDLARTDLLKTQTGTGSVSIQGIAETTSYYLTITLLGPAEGEYSAAELAAIGGKLNVSFIVE